MNYKKNTKYCLTVRNSLEATLGGGIYSKNHAKQELISFLY